MDNITNELSAFPNARPIVQTEFHTNTNLEKVVEQLIIDANFESMTEWIETNLVPYSNMVVTEESTIEAKDFCAKLNKLAQNIDSKRKEIESEWKRPFEVFKKKCNALIELCKGTRDKIWQQIKDADDAEKQKKEAYYRQYWNENAGRTALYRDWAVIKEDWYLNRTTTAKKATEDIQKKIDGIKSDLDAIYSLNSKNEAALLAKYADGATLSETIEYNVKIEKQAQERTNKSYATAPIDDDNDDGEIQQLDFRVWVTIKQARALKEFLKVSGIKYGRVED